MAAKFKGRAKIIRIKPPSLLPLFRLGLGGGMGPTNQPQEMFMPHCWESPSPFSVFPRGRRRPQNSLGHRRPRPGGSPWHDFHLVSALQRGCEYNRTTDFHGREIFLWIIRNSRYGAVLCHSAATMQCKYAMKANAPTLRADVNHLERVQRLATRLVRGLRHVPYEGRLRQCNLFSLERRHLRADIILAFTIFKGEVDLNPSDFFLRPPRAGIRGHTYR